jgi:hypothetical protein
MKAGLRAVLIAVAALGAEAPHSLGAERRSPVVPDQDHHGWHDAIVLGNGTVEAVVVPSVGRVIQFPPDIFDAAPLAARVNNDRSVTLTSSASPHFGLRTVRRIALDTDEPVVFIETTDEKTSGEPITPV